MAKQIYVFHILHEGKHTVRLIKADTENEARGFLPEGCTVNKVEVK